MCVLVDVRFEGFLRSAAQKILVAGRGRTTDERTLVRDESGVLQSCSTGSVLSPPSWGDISHRTTPSLLHT